MLAIGLIRLPLIKRLSLSTFLLKISMDFFLSSQTFPLRNLTYNYNTFERLGCC